MINILIQILWIIATIMIFTCGIYFSFKLKFVHLNFRKMIQALKEKTNRKDSISSFQSLTMALAGRIGVGSLAGIALAVYLGGPGVLFWIWITSILCASTTFVESVLAVIFRKKDSGNIYRGGPFYYIMDGLKNKPLAYLYAIIILITFIAGFSTMQINTISTCVSNLINVPQLIVGIIISSLTAVTIFGGVKKIAETTGKLVPLMAIFYVSICLFIILGNIGKIPQIFIDIISSALSFKSFGAGVFTTLLIGMQKGIFSSEVGLGTGSIAAATSDTNNPNNNGLVQTFGIHVENLLIATITVFVIHMSDYQSLNLINPNGIEITLHAFNYHIGNIGPLLITIAIVLFGLSAIITSYYYGESSLKFIKNTNKIDIFLLKIITIIVLVIGSAISSNLLWTIVDIMVGVIAIVNIYALFKLRKTINYRF